MKVLLQMRLVILSQYWFKKKLYPIFNYRLILYSIYTSY